MPLLPFMISAVCGVVGTGVFAASTSAEPNARPSRVPLRGVHIDLTCQQYQPHYIRNLMRTVAAYDCNAILMEYSDSFPFHRHPGISLPNAFTPQDLADIRETAESHGQEIIPFLQCLGHLEYILHKPGYTELGERHGGYMYCPRDERALPFIKGLIDEILAQHPQARRLLIGGDEVSPGHCAECKRYVAEHGLSQWYVDHYRQVADYCIDKGVQPLMWTDMILKHPAALEQLPREIGWIVWDYGTRTDPTPSLWHGADMNKLDELDPAYVRYFSDAIGLPTARQRGGFHAFGHARGFTALGFDAYTAPAARAGGDNFDLPRFNLHLDNIRLAFEKAAEYKLAGTIITSWSYRGAPHEVCLPLYAACAYGAEPLPDDNPAFMRAFLHQRYGLGGEDTELARAILDTSDILPMSTIAQPSYDTERHAWIMTAATQLEQLEQIATQPDKDATLRVYGSWLSHMEHTASLLDGALASAERNRAELEHWKLSVDHLAHRLRFAQPMIELAAIAYGDQDPENRLVREQEQALAKLAGPRNQLRDRWRQLYKPIVTPAHLEIQLYNRFDAELEMIEILKDDLGQEAAN